MNITEDVAGQTSLRGRRAKHAFARRLASSMKLVGFTAEDDEQIKGTRDLLMPYADAIAAGFYAQLLSHPETAEYFATVDGRPDRTQLMLRTDALDQWLRMAIEAPLDDHLAANLAAVGRAHARRGGDPSARVKARYLVAAISIIQTQVIAVLDRELPDRRAFVASVTAWGKLLTLHLDLFLAVYGTAEGSPHWY